MIKHDELSNIMKKNLFLLNSISNELQLLNYID